MIDSKFLPLDLIGLFKRRCMHAFGFSIAGLRRAWQEEAFRVEAVVALALVPWSLSFDISGLERAVLIIVVMMVLLVEIMNTAIEVTIDRISSERHPLSRQAKDLGSAAVLLSIAIAAITWLSVLWL